MPKLFVYGTLRKGERNAFLLEEAQILESQKVLIGYEMRAFSGKPYAFPYAFINPEGKIIGEIYMLSQSQLEGPIDALERVAEGHYVRHFDPQADLYIYLKKEDNRHDFDLIEGGDWQKYREGLV